MTGGQSPEMIDEHAADCDTFTRYLCGTPADDYIRGKYAVALELLNTAAEDEPIDRALLEAGRRGGFHLTSADCYAKFFRPRTALRQKLIIVLAIIENAPNTHRYLNSAAGGGFFLTILRIFALLTGTAIAMTAGVLRFGPRQFTAQRVAPVRVEATDPR